MSISVAVSGGNRFQKHIVNQAVNWCMGRLLPKVRRIHIDVQLKNVPDADGYCENMSQYEHEFVGSSPRTFRLEIDKRLHFVEMVSTIIHEMVHVKQYVFRELHDQYSTVKWKSKKLPVDMKYDDQPWEKEAFRLQERLLSPLLTEVEFSTDVNEHGFAKTR